MDFAVTATQSELKGAARRYLGDRYPTSRIAELAEAGAFDLDAWPELERQGWLDAELGIVELALLAEEGGRALHPVPWWASAGLAVPIFDAAAVELPGPATLADGRETCRATTKGGEWRLDGRVSGVVDARFAVEIVVAAAVDGKVALFGVQPGAGGVSLMNTAGIDPLRVVSELSLSGAPARLLVGAPDAGPLLESTRRRADVLLAAEAVGVADRALALAVDYAKTREQFDRPIGSYQAVAHLLADSYAELELARSLAYRAACTLDDAAAGDPVEAIACATHAGGQAAVSVCEAAIQVFGGIGATWEYPLHWWYRRAVWLDSFHSGRTDPLGTLADTLLGAA